MESLLSDERYNFLSEKEKQFIIAFDHAITKAGYESNGIAPYVCLGKYKIEYSKLGLKTKKYAARFYFRDSGIVLRMYFTNIDKHREYIETAPDFIKAPFTDSRGKCRQCDKNGGGIGKTGKCTFKKTYTIDGKLYEKCSGETFYFDNYDLKSIPLYMELLAVFYPDRKKRE